MISKKILTFIFLIEQSVVENFTFVLRPFSLMTFSVNLWKTVIRAYVFLFTYVMQRGSAEGSKDKKHVKRNSF